MASDKDSSEIFSDLNFELWNFPLDLGRGDDKEEDFRECEFPCDRG